MCGIAAILCHDRNTTVHPAKMLGDSIRRLMNRGYDSMGFRIMCAPLSEQQSAIFEEKAIGVGCHDKIRESLDRIPHMNGFWNGIAHTRWATHGCVSIRNTHPISDDHGSVIVHNGIIENEAVLRAQLRLRGVVFTTDTDTEVMIRWISLIRTDPASPDEWRTVVSDVLSNIEGTYGIVVQSDRFPGCLLCARRGSPLLVGQSLDGSIAMAVSEKSGFHPLIHHYYELNHNDVVILENDGERITVRGGVDGSPSIEVGPRDDYDYRKDEASTCHEIRSQKDTLMRAINYGARVRGGRVVLGGLMRIRDRLIGCRILYILGCGTSYYAAMIGARFFRRVCPSIDLVLAMDASEFAFDVLHRGMDESSCCIVISQSGETFDLFQVIRGLRGDRPGIALVGIINVVDSMIARSVDAGVYMNCGREIGVASTKSFTASLVILFLIAHHIRELHGSDETVPMILPAIVEMSDGVGSFIESHDQTILDIASRFLAFENILIVGRGSDYLIGLEGALKIKELAYVHSEACSSSTLKHGPLALIGADTPVIFLMTDKEHHAQAMNSIREISAREGRILLISSSTDVVSTDMGTFIVPEMPNLPCFPNIYAIVFLQLFAYHLAILKGHNPDFPRNLAKVVTVA